MIETNYQFSTIIRPSHRKMGKVENFQVLGRRVRRIDETSPFWLPLFLSSFFRVFGKKSWQFPTKNLGMITYSVTPYLSKYWPERYHL